jgi:hypothetical protein
MIKNILAILFALHLQTNAATILFDLYEGLGGDGVEITATLNESENNGVDLILSNKSTINSVVTTFAFQDLTGSLLQPTTTEDWTVNNTLNIPAEGKINFDTTYGFQASPPPTQNGINSGEELLIELMGMTLQEMVYNFNTGDLRIAMHVQSIGQDAISSSYVSRSPEPTIPLYLGLAGMCLIFFRRRRY